MSQSNERSAEFWRGVLDTAKQAGYSKLSIYGYEQLLAAAEAREGWEKCRVCNGTGIERSSVCHCGESMGGHSAYDNHSALEMERACESCTAALKAQLATAAEVIEATEYVVLQELRQKQGFGDTDDLRRLRDLIAKYKEANGGK